MCENTLDRIECYVADGSGADQDPLTCNHCGCCILYDDQPCSALDDERCRP
jgi:hypothetical protein